MAETYKVEKGKARFLNIVFLALCFISVLAYFVFPLWKAEVTYTMNGDEVKDLFGGGDETTQAIADELSKQDLEIHASLVLKTSTVVFSFSSSGYEILDELIEANADSLVQDLAEFVDTVTPVAVKAAAKAAVKSEIEKISGEGVEFKDPDNLDEQLDNVIDALQQDGATVDSVTDATLSALENVYVAETEQSMTEEQKQRCREEIEAVLETLADENGNIDTKELTAQILLQIFEEANGENPPAEGEEGNSGTSPAFANAKRNNNAITAHAEELSANDRLKEKLKTEIHASVSENAANVIAIVVKIVGGALLFSMFTWVWVALKIFFKFTSERPLVKLWLPICFGWFPALILYLLPSRLLKSAMFAASFAAEGVTLSIFSSSVFAGIAGILTMVLSLAYRNLKYRVFEEDTKQSK